MFRSAQDVDGAIDETGRWADSLPGDFTIEVSDYDDGVVIEISGTLISSGLVVRAWLRLDPVLVVRRYRFHVQHGDGLLVWRQDRHPGHEDVPGMRVPSTCIGYGPAARSAFPPTPLIFAPPLGLTGEDTGSALDHAAPPTRQHRGVAEWSRRAQGGWPGVRPGYAVIAQGDGRLAPAAGLTLRASVDRHHRGAPEPDVVL